MVSSLVHGQFPQVRLRRPRQFSWSREMMQENWLSPRDLIWPLFVRDPHVPKTIDSLPGVPRYTIDELPAVAEKACQLGISALAIFPCVGPENKSPLADEAYKDDSLICQAFQKLRSYQGDLGLIADVALDPYTTHGHDGVLTEKGDEIDNDRSIDALAKQAVVLAQAGAQVVAPSDMMDGRIGHIRQALDQAGFQDVMIMTYGAKYSSHFYAPYRDAVGSGTFLKGANKLTYQLCPANKKEALREVAMDLAEGADFVIVKPGMIHLDVIAAVKETFHVPTFAWHVSAEYAMLKAAAEKGWIDFESCLMESLLCFKRAGADGILTYGAPLAAEIMQREKKAA
ncbi:porphobilinogen synthase [Alphaproteobacteria bacterium]|nr:porphobilinogen synthase [Alphaproteobacteria bacterium]